MKLKNLMVLFSMILANQLPASAQQIPSGKYVDLVGSEDWFVVIKNGRVSSSQCIIWCPPVSQFQILKLNSSIPAIMVKDHQNNIMSMCLESTAPSWAKRFTVAYCSFDKGWTKDDQRTIRSLE